MIIIAFGGYITTMLFINYQLDYDDNNKDINIK